MTISRGPTDACSRSYGRMLHLHAEPLHSSPGRGFGIPETRAFRTPCAYARPDDAGRSRRGRAVLASQGASKKLEKTRKFFRNEKKKKQERRKGENEEEATDVDGGVIFCFRPVKPTPQPRPPPHRGASFFFSFEGGGEGPGREGGRGSRGPRRLRGSPGPRFGFSGCRSRWVAAPARRSPVARGPRPRA